MKKTTFLSSVLVYAGLGVCMWTSCGQSGSTASNEAAAPSESASAQPAAQPAESPFPAVDLGLTVRWATCNVGATKPEEFGGYFAWGETKAYGEEDQTNLRNYASTDSTSYVKQNFDWPNYKYCDGKSSSLTKYCTEAGSGQVDGKYTLDLADDAAHAAMGGKWRMPTNDELADLREKCTWTWTTLNGVTGYNVSSANGNSIFLPAAGCRSNQSHGLTADKGPKHVGGGDYWSSSICNNNRPESAYRLSFGEKVVTYTLDPRCEGASIRAVCE
ncbi:MAG: hypothetical protein K6E86_09610 [Bacteroidales bacterium]|nr:hypothetical protein [Bacteroidales bacterium]